MSNASLPKSFQELERFVAEWALPTEVERSGKRLSSSMDDLRELYDAVLARWGEILGYLKGLPAHDVPAEGQRLLELSYSFVEVSQAVERFGQPDIPDACDASRLVTVEGGSVVLPVVRNR